MDQIVKSPVNIFIRIDQFSLIYYPKQVRIFTLYASIFDFFICFFVLFLVKRILFVFLIDPNC
ncbi:hypothetical protein A9G03_01830 [Gilliamella sp. wkB171]|nr:hypothetical protein A9G03_01830 [Gilliamella apicola]